MAQKLCITTNNLGEVWLDLTAEEALAQIIAAENKKRLIIIGNNAHPFDQDLGSIIGVPYESIQIMAMRELPQ